MYDKRKNMIRMKRCLAIAIICFLAVVSVFGADGKTEIATNRQMLYKYNVVWDTPSKDSSGSMPIGNGDIGAGDRGGACVNNDPFAIKEVQLGGPQPPVGFVHFVESVRLLLIPYAILE